MSKTLPHAKTLQELIGAHRGAQRTLAQQLDVSDSSIYRYLHGRNPKCEIAIKIGLVTNTIPVLVNGQFLYMEKT